MPHSSSKQFITFIGATLIVLLAIVVSLCLVIPKGNEVLWVNGNYSAFQDTFFSSITMIGDTMMFVILIGLMAFIRFNYSILLGVVFILNSALVLLFKKILFPEMLRPTALLDNSLLHFIEGVDIKIFNSFPSGHTATAFAMVIALSLFLKHKGWYLLLLIIAILIGYSRIYLLQHHLMDVAAGAFIGVSSSFIVYYLKPTLYIHRLYRHLQTRYEVFGEVYLLPPFIVNSNRVRRWADRISREVNTDLI